jgi:hypothetical protein
LVRVRQLTAARSQPLKQHLHPPCGLIPPLQRLYHAGGWRMPRKRRI